MASIEDTGKGGYNSATDFFQAEPVEKGIVARKSCLTRALTISDKGPLYVHLPPEDVTFVDPKTFRLRANLKVKKKDGGNWVDLTADDVTKVAPVNMFSKALFKNVDVFIQAQPITRIATAAHGYKSYIETLCSYGKDAAKGHLRTSYYEADVPGKMDVVGTGNAAFAKRHKFIALSREIIVDEPIQTELSTLSKLIPSHVTIDFKFTLEETDTVLQSSEGTYLIQVNDFYLTYDRITLSKKLQFSFESRMTKLEKAIFPITRGVVRTKQVMANESNFLWSDLYVGQLPESIIIAMVDSLAYNGEAKKNYFNFQHFNMSSISLKKNSITIPTIPIETDFAKNEVTQLARHFYDNIGVEISNSPSLITPEFMQEGGCLIPFDLTNDRCAQFHNHEKETGVIELILKFSKPLTQGITIIALCSYTDTFYITGGINNRQIIVPSNLI